MTDHMEEERNLLDSLAGIAEIEVLTQITAAALSAAEQRERERILILIELFPQEGDGPADASERVKWALNNIAAAIRGTNHDYDIRNIQ